MPEKIMNPNPAAMVNQKTDKGDNTLPHKEIPVMATPIQRMMRVRVVCFMIDILLRSLWPPR